MSCLYYLYCSSYKFPAITPYDTWKREQLDMLIMQIIHTMECYESVLKLPMIKLLKNWHQNGLFNLWVWKITTHQPSFTDAGWPAELSEMQILCICTQMFYMWITWSVIHTYACFTWLACVQKNSTECSCTSAGAFGLVH